MRITNIVQYLREAGGVYIEEMLRIAAKNNLNRDCGRLRTVIEGKDLELLNIKPSFGKLKGCKVIIGNNSSKGSSIWGATIVDSSGKPVESFVHSYDVTRGKEPIEQIRRLGYYDGEKVFAESSFTNYNRTIGENPSVTLNISEENGILKGSASIDKTHFYDASSKLSPEEYQAIMEKTGLHMHSKHWVKETVTSNANPQEQRNIMKCLIKQFHYKQNSVEKLSKRIGIMDMDAVMKEMERRQEMLKRSEDELEKIYSEVVGSEYGSGLWKKDIINAKATKKHLITGKDISEKDITKIKKRMQKYLENRIILESLAQRKTILLNLQVFDREFLEQAFNRYGIKTDSMLNPKLISQLKEIRNLPANKLIPKMKDIMCEHYGLPKELIKISESSEMFKIPKYSAAFMPQFGQIFYHPSILELPPETAINIIAHEIDHFFVHAQVAKNLGLEQYKSLLFKGEKSKESIFSDILWMKILSKIQKDEKLNLSLYLDAIKNYQSMSSFQRKNIAYMANPLEQRAYQMGFETQYAFNGGNISINSANMLLMSKICTKLEKQITKLEQILGEKFDVISYTQTLEQRAANSVNEITSASYKHRTYEKMSELLESDIEKAIAGTLKYPVKKEPKFVVKKISTTGKFNVFEEIKKTIIEKQQNIKNCINKNSFEKFAIEKAAF